MANEFRFPPKNPSSVDFRFVIWCDIDNTNDGSASDDGELQGATISTSSWSFSPAAELTEDSSNTNAVTVEGVSYSASTVATITLSAGTDGTDYTVINTITTSDGRTLYKTCKLLVTSSVVGL